MAISLASLSKGRCMSAPRVVVFGSQKIGKSTFAASSPSPVFIQTEDGLSGIDTTAFPLAKTYQDVLDAIDVLINEPHDYKTVVLDSIDWLESLIWKHVAALHGKDNIEDFGYGRGYALAVDVWQIVLDKLNQLRLEKNMAVILLAHHQIKRFDAPDSEPYDRYQIKLHKSASGKVQEWADVIGFANHKVMTKKDDLGFGNSKTRAIGTGERLLYLQEKPAFMAGNRFGLPEHISLNWAAFLQALTHATTTNQEAA